MELILTNVGYQEDEKNEVNVNDVIKLYVHDLGIFSGIVDTVTQDYIAIKKANLLKAIGALDLAVTLNNPTIFYNDEIYRIVKVVGGAA